MKPAEDVHLLTQKLSICFFCAWIFCAAGFILGLTDFLADALALPAGRQSPLPYLITVLPPLAVAVTNPDIFLKALDVAGECLISPMLR